MQIVAIVSSTGGLHAACEVLAALPADLDVAIVVLQHLDPHGQNLLARLLARDTAMPVTTAGDGTLLRAGQVLVAPTGQHTLITPELRIALVPSGASPPARPSADLLLTTLALAAGADATAVILSGHGHDGAEGAAALKRFGGRVIVGDRDTSEVFDMPRAAIEAGVADLVLPLGRIGPALLGGQTPTAPPIRRPTP